MKPVSMPRRDAQILIAARLCLVSFCAARATIGAEPRLAALVLGCSYGPLASTLAMAASAAALTGPALLRLDAGTANYLGSAAT